MHSLAEYKLPIDVGKLALLFILSIITHLATVPLHACENVGSFILSPYYFFSVHVDRHDPLIRCLLSECDRGRKLHLRKGFRFDCSSLILCSSAVFPELIEISIILNLQHCFESAWNFQKSAQSMQMVSSHFLLTHLCILWHRCAPLKL